MSFISLAEFQFQRSLLVNLPLKDEKDLFFDVGQYYQETIGSEIDERYVLETEKLLNDSYLKAVKESTNYEFQEMITEAVGLASALSYAIKHNNMNNDYFAGAKRLGLALTNISYSV